MLSNLPLTVQQKQYNISNISVDLANSDTVNITSYIIIIIDCNINDRHYSTLCHVLSGAKHTIILGLPFMYMVGAIFNYGCDTVRLLNVSRNACMYEKSHCIPSLTSTSATQIKKQDLF